MLYAFFSIPITVSIETRIAAVRSVHFLVLYEKENKINSWWNKQLRGQFDTVNFLICTQNKKNHVLVFLPLHYIRKSNVCCVAMSKQHEMKHLGTQQPWRKLIQFFSSSWKFRGTIENVLPEFKKDTGLNLDLEATFPNTEKAAEKVQQMLERISPFHSWNCVWAAVTKVKSLIDLHSYYVNESLNYMLVYCVFIGSRADKRQQLGWKAQREWTSSEKDFNYKLF